MPDLSPVQEALLGLVPPAPGEPEIDPETKVVDLPSRSGSFRKRMTLSTEDRDRVVKRLRDCHEQWRSGTSQLQQWLRRWNDRMEGVTYPKDYPWPNASNLSIPLTETHVTLLWSTIVSTMLDNDPIFFVRQEIPSSVSGETVDPNIEWWLNYVLKIQLKIDRSLRQAYFDAIRTPLSVGVIDWEEKTDREFEIQRFGDITAFLQRFPDADSAGLSQDGYRSLSAKLMAGESLTLKVERQVVKYRGPSMRLVELKNFVWSPVDSPDLSYTMFHGDLFRQRADYYRRGMNRNWFDREMTDRMLESTPESSAIDTISQQQDRIEGLSSGTGAKRDEYDCLRGNLRMDLDRDDEEELYHVVYHPKTQSLLRIEPYPYWHNRINYIPFKIRPRTNRLLGRCIPQMLYDLNEEVNTQHNQRIDSRSITIVPSFRKLQSETGLDLSRKDQYFYPGVVFTVARPDGFEQMDIKQTDMGQSLQEENVLFSISEQLTGATTLRSGKENPRDPRAPAKKTLALLAQSNGRIDSYLKDLEEPTSEVARQVMELFFQFAPSSVLPFSRYDQESERWIKDEIMRSSLRNRNIHIDVARTTTLDNPDVVMQRALVDYQIWSKEPLIGMNVKRRHELVRRALFSERHKDISKLLPPLAVVLQELQAQQALNPQSNPMQDLHQAVVSHTSHRHQEPTGRRQGGPDMGPQTLTKGKSGA